MRTIILAFILLATANTYNHFIYDAKLEKAYIEGRVDGWEAGWDARDEKYFNEVVDIADAIHGRL